MWCGSCYRPNRDDGFCTNEPEENAWFDWTTPGWKNDHKKARDGDHLTTAFQCDPCVFRLLRGRNPHDSEMDKLLKCCIRRVNLDALWSRTPPTVSATLSGVNKGFRMSRLVGLRAPCPDLGPHPLQDVCGHGVAIQMVMASHFPGRHNVDCQQFDTIRRLRSACSNVHLASAEGAMAHWTVGVDAKGKRHTIRNCPTDSDWFERFALGCKLRMGQDYRPNLAMSVDVFKVLMEHLERRSTQSETEEERKRHTAVGACCIITYGAALRGNEGFMVDLKGLLDHLHHGKGDSLGPNEAAHVVIPLLGKFKGEDGARFHLKPLVAVTQSGLRIGDWVEASVRVHQCEGRSSGPAFCDDNGNVAASKVCEQVILDLLAQIQQERPDIIGPDVDVHEEHGVCRSFWRGETARARVSGVAELTTKLNNRWRVFEDGKSGGCLAIIDHHSDVRQLLVNHLKFSAAL